ncbi:SDR family NAD(P)-dependent oxidoreductase [Streptomyces sp. NPDC005133]
MPVAGATSGVGWETARILAERGALVLVHGRTAEEARAATGRLIAAGVSEPHLCMYATDLTDSDTAEAMVRAVVGTRPHLDVRARDERVGPAPPATGERLKRPQRRPEPGVLVAAFPYTRLRKGPTMIELLPHRLPALSRWFPAGAPGPAALAEHVLTTGIGRFWADHAVQPRAIAVDCAAHVLLRGDPGALVPAELAPLGSRYIEAPARFLPVLGASFDRIMPWERMVYIRQEEPTSLARTPKGVTVRRITAADADSLTALGPGAAWIHASWGGPAGLAGSGHAWGAFHQGEAVAVACTYFLGSAYEDLAVVTAPDHRRRQLALSCVTALCADVTARGHTPSWSCSRHNSQPAARLERRFPPGARIRPPRHRRTGRPRDAGDENPRMKPHPALRQLAAQVDREPARTVFKVFGPE